MKVESGKMVSCRCGEAVIGAETGVVESQSHSLCIKGPTMVGVAAVKGGRSAVGIHGIWGWQGVVGGAEDIAPDAFAP